MPLILCSKTSLTITPPPLRHTVNFNMSQTPKEQRKHLIGVNIQKGENVLNLPTPRLPPVQAGNNNSTTNTTTTTSQGRKFKTDLPPKQLCNMAVREDGIICTCFPTDAALTSRYPLPALLHTTLQTFRRIDSSVAIIPYTAGQQILKSATQQDIILPPSAIAPPDNSDASPAYYTPYHNLGPTLSLDDAADLARWAAELSATGADEGAWNSFVHARLLALALYPGGRLQHGLVGITQCTTAAIIKEYFKSSTSGVAVSEKSVDFCLHVDPYFDEKDGGAIAEGIDRLALSLPLNSINHTDHDALATRPIAASIKTKKTDGEKAVDAPLQIGVWHRAQWNLLDSLVTNRLAASGRAGGGSSSAAAAVLMPAFLPGIIIKGHDWYFVATTRSGRKTVCPLTALVSPRK